MYVRNTLWVNNFRSCKCVLSPKVGHENAYNNTFSASYTHTHVIVIIIKLLLTLKNYIGNATAQYTQMLIRASLIM